ncbi:LRR repeats and ubiquitin-like domain-containing protein At2g30105 [Euphorbia lathyris]|uniref:LRR repeats and ubiquitin-like domain-containing protein At2g30105 n=1 Tax=Euphorbia lathyris TaxID=212925 RepID=UPI003313DD65
MEGEVSKNPNLINITVKFSGRSIPISISSDSTIRDLKFLLQSHTNVLPRGQKLISKGKMLVDTMTLTQSEVQNGARIMLMGSQGLHIGGGPILKDAETRPISRSFVTNIPVNQKTEFSVDEKCLEKWKATGVVALAERNLKVIPDEVWQCGPSARVLHINDNYLQDLPANIDFFCNLQKLYLDRNYLSTESIHWKGLEALKHLTVLSLSQNDLTTLPAELSNLTFLTQLDVSRNKLNSIPFEIGNLSRLEVLKANNNRISTIPKSMGTCYSLVEVDLSSNHLIQLPDSLELLHNLRALHLGNNGLTSLPRTLLKKCVRLSTLDLHNTEITMDALRQYEGWEAFDERRRTKLQKQLDYRVVGSAEFDEGADKN